MNLTLVKPTMFCNPVNKNGEGVIDPSTHLTCYATPLFTTFERQPNQVTVTDQFGELGLDVRTRSSNLCVPSVDNTASETLSAGASIAALAALPTFEIDQYELFWSKRTPRTTRFERREVNLVDQWIDQDVLLTQPTRFGTPAKDIPPPPSSYVDPEAKLTCYPVRKAARFAKRDVDIQNEFGQERLTVIRPKMLCVPSEELGDDEN